MQTTLSLSFRIARPPKLTTEKLVKENCAGDSAGMYILALESKAQRRKFSEVPVWTCSCSSMQEQYYFEILTNTTWHNNSTTAHFCDCYDWS